MRSLQEHAEEFVERNVRILAVSVDPPEITREHAEKMGYAYPVFLADEKMEVIRRFDLVHEDGSFAVTGGDVARPAEFLLDPNGVIRWRFLAETYRTPDRMKAGMALEAIDAAQSEYGR